jgi:hypothetical protein
MQSAVFDIQITSGNANVTGTYTSALKPGDKVRFTSNREDTAIEFDRDSPFEHPAAGVPFPVGRESAELTVKNGHQAHCHFRCGHMVPGFVPWGGGGSHTP